jgi:hypothetical protein
MAKFSTMRRRKEVNYRSTCLLPLVMAVQRDSQDARFPASNTDDVRCWAVESEEELLRVRRANRELQRTKNIDGEAS